MYGNYVRKCPKKKKNRHATIVKNGIAKDVSTRKENKHVDIRSNGDTSI